MFSLENKQTFGLHFVSRIFKGAFRNKVARVSRRVSIFVRLYVKVLCISTSEQELRMTFAGPNRHSDTKTTFSVTNGTK